MQRLWTGRLAALGSRTASTSNSPRIENVATAAQVKKEGDISDSFVQLSGQNFKPLESRFAALKSRVIAGNEEAVVASWNRLLARLREEISLISTKGSSIIPEIHFSDLDNPPDHFQAEHRKRGVAIVRNVLPEQAAHDLKQDLCSYIAENPQTKAFPSDHPQVYELYWSPTQLRARAHPNILKTQKFLMHFWHSSNPNSPISPSHPVSYADRLRIRQPGDAQFALGPHTDGGSVERWEETGYGRGGVYDKIWAGKWEEYDAFEASGRLPVQSDLYNGAGACSAFRMYQGWLSMSKTAPGEGTLLVSPLLGLATAYYLLRPFFSPKTMQRPTVDPNNIIWREDDLVPENWQLTQPPDSWLHGATPGHGQELTNSLHPHLRLPNSMVSVPEVRPGDYMAWHCDTIHAVDPVHNGETDSSVLYIPSCPLTEGNAHYLKQQRDAFLAGAPGPDFPGGLGERDHKGNWTAEDCAQQFEAEGLRAFGLEPWDSEEEGLTPGQKAVMDRANKLLDFYD